MEKNKNGTLISITKMHEMHTRQLVRFCCIWSGF